MSPIIPNAVLIMDLSFIFPSLRLPLSLHSPRLSLPSLPLTPVSPSLRPVSTGTKRSRSFASRMHGTSCAPSSLHRGLGLTVFLLCVRRKVKGGNGAQHKSLFSKSCSGLPVIHWMQLPEPVHPEFETKTE